MQENTNENYKEILNKIITELLLDINTNEKLVDWAENVHDATKNIRRHLENNTIEEGLHDFMYTIKNEHGTDFYDGAGIIEAGYNRIMLHLKEHNKSDLIV